MKVVSLSKSFSFHFIETVLNTDQRLSHMYRQSMDWCYVKPSWLLGCACSLSPCSSVLKWQATVLAFLQQPREWHYIRTVPCLPINPWIGNQDQSSVELACQSQILESKVLWQATSTAVYWFSCKCSQSLLP